MSEVLGLMFECKILPQGDRTSTECYYPCYLSRAKSMLGAFWFSAHTPKYGMAKCYGVRQEAFSVWCFPGAKLLFSEA
ncbi:MAG TPA: hypothetical protein DGO89_12290 [Microcoleaceae bacterium UBA9251]|jgi:hypothetical protein|nr:hypothetical protein [Microcoleaceae cyanobacterium UBA9251]